MGMEMNDRRVLIYFSWSAPEEAEAPLTLIEDRFPALFELRRLFYPHYESFADAARIDQGVAGFLQHVQRPNFAAFADQATAQTGYPSLQVERVSAAGAVTALDDNLLSQVDTLVVISFDSLRTAQNAIRTEIDAVRKFLEDPGHLIAICPHHDIGEAPEGTPEARRGLQLAEHLHHADQAIPPRQGFGGFARSLLAGLGIPVENQFGLRPALDADGSPAPVEVERSLDRNGLLVGVPSLNAHPHLPHLERREAAQKLLDVLVRQRIDLAAPPHPFTRQGRSTFDALLQSTREAFPGTVLISDTTLFSSTAGGLASLRQFWSNIVGRPRSLQR
jgi:hypothetical protein